MDTGKSNICFSEKYNFSHPDSVEMIHIMISCNIDDKENGEKCTFMLQTKITFKTKTISSYVNLQRMVLRIVMHFS